MKMKMCLLRVALIITPLLVVGPLATQAVTITTDVDSENERVTIDCKKTSAQDTPTPRSSGFCKDHPDDPQCSEPIVSGCDPGASAAGKSATGFYGIGGTNPVPASPPRTCQSGTLCANPGVPNCSLYYPNRTCKNTYTYTNGACACACKP
jgi:hypothetical protein